MRQIKQAGRARSLVSTKNSTETALSGTGVFTGLAEDVGDWATIIHFDAQTPVPPKSDVWFTAKGNGATTAVVVDFEAILIYNDTPQVPQ